MPSTHTNSTDRRSPWGVAGWVIVALAPVWSIASALLWLPQDASFWSGTRTPPALAVAGLLTFAALVILVAKFITGLRSRNAGRLVGVALGWTALFALTWPVLLPAIVPIAALLVISALVVWLSQRITGRRTRSRGARHEAQ